MTDHRAECHDGAFDPACAECVGGEIRTHTRMLDQMRALLAEIRDRLPEPEGVNAVEDEPIDITEEPPVGAQVTDRDGDVWLRRNGWALWDKGVYEWDSGDAEWLSDVQRYAPLRPTTDEDRKRVGLPVEPACGCGAADGYHSPDCPRAPFPPEPAPADVDPDEALGALIWDRIWGTTWSIASEDNRAAYRNLASAVREHIEAEDEDAIQVAHLVEQLRALLNPPAEGEADHE